MDIAKIFWSGRSQAVRIPKEFRFQSELVHIRRHGNAVILEPVATNWAWLDELCGDLDNDFIQASQEKPAQEERPLLDGLFK
tara:strand:- start:465 stop:710 length:246 start_codon:yes stop_codon:yes gene_type:complete